MTAAVVSEELAKIKERADADRLTTWPGDVRRLLALLESRDQRISRLEESAQEVLRHCDLGNKSWFDVPVEPLLALAKAVRGPEHPQREER